GKEALASHRITHLDGGSGIISNLFISKSIGLEEYLKSASLMVGKIGGQTTNEKTYDQATANQYLLEDEDEDENDQSTLLAMKKRNYSILLCN
ncbi:unnamed protein product, partial [Rotaria sp. Silwood2]